MTHLFPWPLLTLNLLLYLLTILTGISNHRPNLFHSVWKTLKLHFLFQAVQLGSGLVDHVKPSRARRELEVLCMRWAQWHPVPRSRHRIRRWRPYSGSCSRVQRSHQQSWLCQTVCTWRLVILIQIICLLFILCRLFHFINLGSAVRYFTSQGATLLHLPCAQKCIFGVSLASKGSFARILRSVGILTSYWIIGRGNRLQKIF